MESSGGRPQQRPEERAAQLEERVSHLLRGSSSALVATLGAVGYLAVRRVPLTGWQRLLALVVLVALGCLVVALEVVAHLL